MSSVTLPGAVLGSGLLGTAGSLFGGASAADAATDAANIQAGSSDRVAQMQLAMFREIQANLKPYLDAGTGALPAFTSLTGTGPGGNPLTAPLTGRFNPTIADLEKTPGYKFTLDQGLKGVQNKYASVGLGGSGAAQKGAIDYAEGLAGTTFNDQLTNYLRQNLQTYNMLGGIVGVGQNSAVQTGTAGLNATGAAGNALLTGANAAASGIIGSTNALTKGIGGALSNIGGAGLGLGALDYFGSRNNGPLGNVEDTPGIINEFGPVYRNLA